MRVPVKVCKYLFVSVHVHVHVYVRIRVYLSLCLLGFALLALLSFTLPFRHTTAWFALLTLELGLMLLGVALPGWRLLRLVLLCGEDRGQLCLLRSPLFRFPLLCFTDM